MNKILMGCLVEMILLFISMVSNNINIFLNGSKLIVIGCLVIAMIISGVFNKDNLHSTRYESSEDRDTRLHHVSTLLFLGIPSLLSLFMLYVFIR
ncbi:DUF5316 family protein [Clostridium manihotivorum]|uniref:DUF5316 domain-containing protein n=1 Tax=Clostridium manihotivorum TaxID=2320868 RepID=A0A410DTA0_9CLOT|nr:DUF5316 family protein [Clostridium manihotivorum]QAA32483.1 hypothetical protein C1I91_12995 [Clostridium manihotivorum]